MRRVVWLGLGLLLVGRDLGTPQPTVDDMDAPYELEGRLDRLEELLDQLIEQEERRRSPAPRPRPRVRRELPPPPPSAPVVLERLVPDLGPTPDVHRPPAVEPAPGRTWTWEEIDAWQAVRALVEGD